MTNDLIERAQWELDSVDGYTKMATTAHDLLEEAITALREQETRIEELEAELKEWESGALVQGWRERREAKTDKLEAALKRIANYETLRKVGQTDAEAQQEVAQSVLEAKTND